MIGGDGRIYEGRGWTTRPGLPVEHKKLNKFSVFIGLAGKYSGEWSRATLTHVTWKITLKVYLNMFSSVWLGLNLDLII